AIRARTLWSWRKSLVPAMSERLPDPPRLTDAQRLWLQEIGLDRPMLARLARPARDAAGAAAAGGAASAGAAHGGRAGVAADTAVLEVGASDGTSTGAAVPDGRSRALAALAALRQGGGERGLSTP